MDPLSCDAILFDMDGTLVDSTQTVYRSWLQWCAEHEVDPERLRDKHGIPAISLVRELLPEHDDDAHLVAAERAAAIEIADAGRTALLPGTMELLTSLPPERWAIVTSCTMPLAEARIQAVGLPTGGALVTADQVRHGKPDPEPYLLGAERLGFAPERCVVIEDAPAGLVSGRAAGCRTVAVTTHHSPDELDADLVVTDLSELRVTVGADGTLQVGGPAH